MTDDSIYGGLWPRGFAYLIDCAVVFVLFAATQLLVFTPVREAVGIDWGWFESGLHTQLYTLATISLPAWLYFALCEQSIWQATRTSNIAVESDVFPTAGFFTCKLFSSACLLRVAVILLLRRFQVFSTLIHLRRLKRIPCYHPM